MTNPHRLLARPAVAVLLCAMFMVIPLITLGKASAFNPLGLALLVLVFLFQTMALFEYTLYADTRAREFLSVRDHIPNGVSIASVVSVSEPARFSPIPEGQLVAYLGIYRNIWVSDNYEIGHYLFPLVAADVEERRFVHELVQVTAIDLADPREDPDREIQKLDSVLSKYHDRLDLIVVWDAHPRVTAVLNKWFESEPYFVNGRVALYRHQ